MIPDPAVREREGRGGRGYFLSDPTAETGQSSSSTYLQVPTIQVSLLGTRPRRKHHTGVLSSFDRLLKRKAHVCADWDIQIQQSWYNNDNNNDDHRWRCALAELDLVTPCDPVLGGKGCPFPHSDTEGTEYRAACGLWRCQNRVKREHY